MREVFLCFMLLCSFVFGNAQELTIKSFTELTNDITARSNPRNDLNDNPCALVKVRMAVDNATFKGRVGDVDYRNGEYYVYMAEGTKRLSVYVPNFLPCDIEFEDHGINSLNGLYTYQLTILTNVINDNNSTPKPITTNNKKIQQSSNTNKNSSNCNIQIAENSIVFTIDTIEFKMVYVEGGTFVYGDKIKVEKDFSTEYIDNVVSVSDFYIGETEVTQELWVAVMGKNTSNEKGRQLPVNCIEYDEYLTFIRRLEEITGYEFRIPNEKEWVWACIGGRKDNKKRFCGYDVLADVAWCKLNSKDKLHDVKKKKPNELGLYDMLGNAEELILAGKRISPFMSTYISDFIIIGGSKYSSQKDILNGYDKKKRKYPYFDGYGYATSIRLALTKM